MSNDDLKNKIEETFDKVMDGHIKDLNRLKRLAYIGKLSLAIQVIYICILPFFLELQDHQWNKYFIAVAVSATLGIIIEYIKHRINL